MRRTSSAWFRPLLGSQPLQWQAPDEKRPRLQSASVGFLVVVSITPFPARPLIEHLAGDEESKTAALVYLGVAAAPATWWFVRWIYATAKALPDPRLTDDYLRRLTIKYGVTAGAYWAAFTLAFWNWRVGLIAAGIVTLSYIVPPASLRSDQARGRSIVRQLVD